VTRGDMLGGGTRGRKLFTDAALKKKGGQKIAFFFFGDLRGKTVCFWNGSQWGGGGTRTHPRGPGQVPKNYARGIVGGGTGLLSHAGVRQDILLGGGKKKKKKIKPGAQDGAVGIWNLESFFRETSKQPYSQKLES